MQAWKTLHLDFATNLSHLTVAAQVLLSWQLQGQGCCLRLLFPNQTLGPSPCLNNSGSACQDSILDHHRLMHTHSHRQLQCSYSRLAMAIHTPGNNARHMFGQACPCQGSLRGNSRHLTCSPGQRLLSSQMRLRLPSIRGTGRVSQSMFSPGSSWRVLVQSSLQVNHYIRLDCRDHLLYISECHHHTVVTSNTSTGGKAMCHSRSPLLVSQSLACLYLLNSCLVSLGHYNVVV